MHNKLPFIFNSQLSTSGFDFLKLGTDFHTVKKFLNSLDQNILIEEFNIDQNIKFYRIQKSITLGIKGDKCLYRIDVSNDFKGKFEHEISIGDQTTSIVKAFPHYEFDDDEIYIQGNSTVVFTLSEDLTTLNNQAVIEKTYIEKISVRLPH